MSLNEADHEILFALAAGSLSTKGLNATLEHRSPRYVQIRRQGLEDGGLVVRTGTGRLTSYDLTPAGRSQLPTLTAGAERGWPAGVSGGDQRGSRGEASNDSKQEETTTTNINEAPDHQGSDPRSAWVDSAGVSGGQRGWQEHARDLLDRLEAAHAEIARLRAEVALAQASRPTAVVGGVVGAEATTPALGPVPCRVHGWLNCTSCAVRAMANAASPMPFTPRPADTLPPETPEEKAELDKCIRELRARREEAVEKGKADPIADPLRYWEATRAKLRQPGREDTRKEFVAALAKRMAKLDAPKPISPVERTKTEAEQRYLNSSAHEFEQHLEASLAAKAKNGGPGGFELWKQQNAGQTLKSGQSPTGTPAPPSPSSET